MRSHSHSRATSAPRTLAFAVVALLMVVALPMSVAQAAAARVLLRVLVVSNGDPSADAIATQLDREGVPYTKVQVNAPGRPVIDAAFLADAATSTANFQGVVLPNQAGGGLSAAEVAALTAYERAYGVRQVSAYDYPGANVGMQSPTYSGPLDGAAATVAAAGLAGPFSYLRGSFAIDDFAPGLEVYGYLAAPSTTLPAGESFTPFLTASTGAQSGVLAGVYARGGREELVLSAAYNPDMKWFNEVSPGIVSWLTRGIHLGYQRNYFAVNIDDIFLADGRWSVTSNCTPGDDCIDPKTTTPDIRMASADVPRLTQWQNTNAFKFDLVYNGGGSDLWRAQNGGADPFADTILAAQGQFPWINHTLTHPFLGCIQIAPTVLGQTWRCATSATDSPRQDPEVPQQLSGGVYWASQAYVRSQIADNAAWGTARGLTDFDARELVTGEHSGLLVTPQQPIDSPFIGPVLTDLGVRFLASDASREKLPRTVGTATTAPRHPMNIYYNTATYQEQIDEYNWYYTSRANGGSGICEDNPATSTCIAPLPAGGATAARASFDSYLKPLEVRNALKFVLTNDPSPFYAHQSNLTEDGILYPVVDGVLADYRSVFASNTPLVRLDMTGQGAALAAMNSWKASSGAAAYIDASGVHVPDVSANVPLTVPTGTTVNGTTLESYGGALSGWANGTLTAVPPVTFGGYVDSSSAPAAPTIGSATAGNASATVTWTAPASTGGSPITGYSVRVVDSLGAQVGALRPSGATTTSLAVTGLTNGAAVRFQVQATNAVGAGAFSALSNTVTPAAPATGAPTVTARAPANGATGVAATANVTATFSEPVTGVSGTTFVLRAGSGAAIAASVTYDATTRVATLNPTANLAAGTQYTATLTGGSTAIRDTGGTPLATASWSFTTAGTAPSGAPTVVSRSPASGATGASRINNITTRFSEAVAGVNSATFTLRNTTSGASVAGAVTYFASTFGAILNPNVTLAANTRYTATLTGGSSAIRDTGGTALVTTSWTFTTGA